MGSGFRKLKAPRVSGSVSTGLGGSLRHGVRIHKLLRKTSDSRAPQNRALAQFAVEARDSERGSET